MESREAHERIYSGIAASPGIAHGKVFLASRNEVAVPRYTIVKSAIASETARLDDAIVKTRRDIQSIQEEIRSSIGEDEARIFDAHLLVLEDQALVGEALRDMESSLCNIESAVWDVGHRYIEAFDRIDDEYLRERASDIRDVMRRLLSNLTGQRIPQLDEIAEPSILVANDVTPSDSASIDREKVLGLVTEVGSKTSHAVIVARSMNIPAVVGVAEVCSQVSREAVVLIDGYDGKVIVNPSEDTLFKYGNLRDKRRSREKRLIAYSKAASLTRDGHPVQLMANIERADEAERALEMGADGIGLFRSEYLFMGLGSLPSEEEQFEAYRAAVVAMGDRPVVIRTLDLGGDKVADFAEMPVYREANPFLGYRAIRFCLDHQAIFKSQLRAILRASAFGDARLMYPMISGASELNQANALLDEAKSELRSEGQAFNEDISVGTMIEIPSAAIAADTLVEGSAFFSIGTNDLIQYLIAVDRLNDRVADLYDPTHPAVLRTLDMIVSAARKGGVGVSLCGEVAGDPVIAPLLIGLGVEALSMSPNLLPNVKYVVQNMDLSEAKEIAAMALEEPSGAIIHDRLVDLYKARMDQLQ